MGNSPSTPQKSEEEKNATLSEYFDYLYSEKLRFKRPDEEVQDIKEAVREMVNYITDELAVVDPRFSISNVKSVGSMMENTSNGEPKEFDFLLVVDSLSLSSNTTLVRECDGKKGYVHMVLKEDASNEFVATWGDIIKNRRLRSTKTGLFTHGFRDRFREALNIAVKNLKRVNGFKIVRSNGELRMHGEEIENHGPACMYTFEWISVNDETPRRLIIHVDMTVAVRFADISTIIQEGEVGNEEYFQELHSSGVFMAISGGKSTCSDGFCFRLTFTNTEVKLMFDLSKHHRKCYRILKYLFNGLDPTYAPFLLFHSYSIKTFLLKHNGSCSRSDEDNGGLAMCVTDVLDAIKRCLNESQSRWYYWTFCITVPCILLPTHNIYDRKMDKKLLKENKKAFKAMTMSMEAIAKMDLADTAEERLNQFKSREILTARSYIQPPPNFYIPYNNLHSCRNMMMMNTMRMHSMRH